MQRSGSVAGSAIDQLRIENFFFDRDLLQNYRKSPNWIGQTAPRSHRLPFGTLRKNNPHQCRRDAGTGRSMAPSAFASAPVFSTPAPRRRRQCCPRACAPPSEPAHTRPTEVAPSPPRQPSPSPIPDVLYDGLSPPASHLAWCADPAAPPRPASAAGTGEPDAAFVNTFRTSSPYIHAYHGLTFVIHIPGALLDEDLFEPLMQDIALMRAIGIKPVLVLGPRAQIDRRLAAECIPSQMVDGMRVTDAKTLQIIKEAAGGMRFEVEGVLARGVVNMPSASRVSVVSGSFFSAQPVGILGGTDFGYTGRVRRIDTEAIERRLSQGDIIVLPNVGFSPSGQLFNCASEAVAGACARQLRAEKLIFLAAGDAIVDARNGRPVPNLTFATAAKFVEDNAGKLPAGFRMAVEQCVGALRDGVRRTHILNRRINGVLLMEVFHRDGIGLMISSDEYEGIRPAAVRDVRGMLEIITPLVRKGVLRRRERAAIERSIADYFVVERDGMIIACLSLCVAPGDSEWAELGCFAVHAAYRKLGKGDAMMGFVERVAYARGVRNLFILSTQSFHFFMERGFDEIGVDDLPPGKQAHYDMERKPKIFRLLLKDAQRRPPLQG